MTTVAISRNRPRAQTIRAHGETAAIVVGQLQASAPQLAPKHTILFKQITKDISFLATQPPGEKREQQLERGGVEHGGSLSHGPQVLPSSVDPVMGHYGLKDSIPAKTSAGFSWRVSISPLAGGRTRCAPRSKRLSTPGTTPSKRAASSRVARRSWNGATWQLPAPGAPMRTKDHTGALLRSCRKLPAQRASVAAVSQCEREVRFRPCGPGAGGHCALRWPICRAQLLLCGDSWPRDSV